VTCDVGNQAGTEGPAPDLNLRYRRQPLTLPIISPEELALSRTAPGNAYRNTL